MVGSSDRQANKSPKLTTFEYALGVIELYKGKEHD